jgi:hypothetical protein
VRVPTASRQRVAPGRGGCSAAAPDAAAAAAPSAPSALRLTSPPPARTTPSCGAELCRLRRAASIWACSGRSECKEGIL